MVRQPVELGKYDGPGQIGLMADHFGVEKIAEADEAGDQCRRHHHAIDELEKIDSLKATQQQERGYEDFEKSAVARQTAGPDFYE